jgi:hypothetical protein
MHRGFRNCEPITLTERDHDVVHFNIRMLPEYRALDNWMRCEVEPQALRDMHGNFGRDGWSLDLRKGARFDQLLEHFREHIDRDDFPAAADIRLDWPDKPPIVVLRMVKTGEIYLCDGEKRVFNACYHGETAIRALMAHVDEDRDIVHRFP